MAAREQTQLAVIGAGPGGYAAAFLAADLGLDVTLIDPAPHPGGVCLYRGCIPSKALLHVAQLVGEARRAADWGVHFDAPRIDLDRLRAWKDQVVTRLTTGLGELCRRRKIDYVEGRARFRDARSLAIETTWGGERALRFDAAIVATGSSPVGLGGFPAGSPRVLDSTTALAIEEVPARLLVVGGGYIGLELGSVYAALGSRVTVVEMLPDLLAGADSDLVRPLRKALDATLAALHCGTRVVRAVDSGTEILVTLEGAGAPASEAAFDRVLVAVGRRPNGSGIGLETTRATLDEQGFVEVDAQLRTAEPTIWAIGDVVGQPMLAHKAAHEGRAAVEAVAGHKTVFEPAAIPAVVFTEPEVAWCGLTEAEAKRQKRPVQVARFPWAASGRAATLGGEEGLTKLLIDPDTQRILGAGIVGPRAGELIAEVVVAIEMAALAGDLKLCIHPHPTLSETLMEAAELFFGQSTHVFRPRRASR